MTRSLAILFAASITLISCAETTVTPVSANQVMITTSAAPACGISGAQQVAAKMAAVETLRRGFERFTVAGASAQNNVRVTQTSPTGSYTSGSFNSYGNTVYGSANTTYYGGGPVYSGSNDASLLVVMYRKGDRGFTRAVDAKATLGEEWETLVEKGVPTCS